MCYTIPRQYVRNILQVVAETEVMLVLSTISTEHCVHVVGEIATHGDFPPHSKDKEE